MERESMEVRRYPFSAFAKFAAISDSHKRRTAIPKIKLPQQQPIRGKRNSQFLASLVNDCLTAPEGERSEFDFRLCCEAVEHGWDKSEVWDAAAGVGKFAERGREYFDRTWIKAESHTRQKIYDQKAGEVAARKAKQSGAEQPPVESGKIEFYRAALERIQLDVLGRYNGKIKVFSRHTRAVETIGNPDLWGYSQLAGVAGEPFINNVERYSESESPNGVLDLRTIQEAIGLASSGREYPEGDLKGAGCWPCLDPDENDNIAIVGLKTAAYWTGSTLIRRDHPVLHNLFLQFEHCDWQQWYEFDELEAETRKAADKQYRVDALNELIDLLRLWNWGHASMPMAAAGVILASWIQTVWHWRPQILVGGESNSGKTTLFRLLSGIYGDLAMVSSQSTAAGLRQTLETTAKIPLCDEFDVHNKTQKFEQDRILKMIRDSGRGGRTLRGTAHQRAKNFVLRHIFWMAGTNVDFEDATDKNRFIIFDLKPAAAGRENKLVLPRESTLRRLGVRLFASVLQASDRALQLAGTLVRETPEISQAHSRQIESYSVPAAMLAAILGDDDSAAGELLRTLMAPVSEQEEHQVRHDHETLMDDIFTAHIPQKAANQQLVSQLISDSLENSSDASRILEQHGLKVDFLTAREAEEIEGAEEGGRCLLIHPAVVRKSVLYNTQWQANGFKRAILGLRLITHGKRRMGKRNTTTLVIDWRAVADQFEDESGGYEQQTEF